MKIEIEILSKERIRPSSSTPQHLKTFKLSLLDHLIPSPYVPIILFYPMSDCSSHLDVSKRLDLLKQSLSETLTRFYPLAGTIKDDLSIECNDKGAYYVEARVNCRLKDYLMKPDVMLVHKFLPCDLSSVGSNAGTNVTNIQVNIFQCGGIAIGLCISHKILDGAAMSTFLKAWTTTTCGTNEEISPDFMATLFPTNDDLWLRDTSIHMWGSLFKKGKSTTRRLVFDSSSIRTLKAKIAGSCAAQLPTRVEAVSAFLWNRFMAVSRANHGFQRPSLLTHLVNLRRRIASSFPENTLRNLLWIAAAKSLNGSDPELHDLVGEVRESISAIDGDFVKKMRGNEGNSLMSENLKEIGEFGSREGVDYYAFTSWCKFGFNEADFGWGKPVWVSSLGMEAPVFLNFVILVDTSFGDGIEAWVTLDEQDMTILEHDHELLAFACLDPSPLAIANSDQKG